MTTIRRGVDVKPSVVRIVDSCPSEINVVENELAEAPTSSSPLMPECLLVEYKYLYGSTIHIFNFCRFTLTSIHQHPPIYLKDKINRQARHFLITKHYGAVFYHTLLKSTLAFEVTFAAAAPLPFSSSC